MDLKKLRAAFDETLAKLADPVLAFPWERPETYAFWLAQSYYLVRHTTTLITLTAAKFGPGEMERHRHSLAHLKEEIGHDDMVLHDLKALGLKAESFPELVETSVIYQSQYYWIERCSPIALAGYSVLLEGLAATVGQRIYERVEAAHGKQAGTFLKLHAQADVGHYKAGVDELRNASEQEIRYAMRNLEQGGVLYRGMLDSIVREAGVVKRVKKAA